MAQCESTYHIAGRSKSLRCDQDAEHYRREPGSRTRHRVYLGGPCDGELTWDDALPGLK